MAKIKTSYEMVKEFHQAFGHPVETSPLTPSVKQMKFRARFLLEEVSEHILALGARKRENQHLARAVELIELARAQVAVALDYEFNDVDMIEVADSLGDLDYIVNGAALTYGIPLPAITKEIHDSNMTKLGEDGKPIYDDEGKVIKGPAYRRPNLDFIFNGGVKNDSKSEAQ
jgi:predicted HAD superfamily Cof-like phosphohydrolase